MARQVEGVPELVPEVGDYVTDNFMFAESSARVGKVTAVYRRPFTMGAIGSPSFDISVYFDSRSEITPHWKLRVLSPLEALALQGDA